jgi:hypothetical protein
MNPAERGLACRRSEKKGEERFAIIRSGCLYNYNC